VAEPEKAVLDTLYFMYNYDYEDFEAFRFNKSAMVNTLDSDKMDQYALIMNNLTFQKRYNRFKKWLYVKSE
jgi:hypothetical protein